MKQEIKSFTDLEAWKKSHELVIEVFEVFSNFDQFNSLKLQIERCAISITSNIAEGFGRQTIKDTHHFYVIARGSAYELQNQLLIARDTKKISNEEFKKIAEKSVNSIKLIHGLIRSLKRSK